MRTKFLGQGSGRAVANQTIGKREHRLTSLICLYRRAVSPSEYARQKSSKLSKKTSTSHLKLSERNIAQ